MSMNEGSCNLMIRKERADETTRSIDALSRSRTALVTELWALSLFDFIDRSGDTGRVPRRGHLLSPLRASGVWRRSPTALRWALWLPRPEDLFSLSVFPDPRMPRVRRPRHLGWPLKFGIRLLTLFCLGYLFISRRHTRPRVYLLGYMGYISTS